MKSMSWHSILTKEWGGPSLTKEWPIPGWFVKTCILLIFTVPATIYLGIESFLGGEQDSISFLLFPLFLGITGVALISMIGFLLRKSFGKRFGEKSFRFTVAVLIISLIVWSVSTFFQDIITDAFSVLRNAVGF
jgi:uncharacterized membrane protein